MMPRKRPVAPTVLHGVSDSLALPLPDKTRFLEELAADLRALTSSLVADGLTAEEARQRALDALVPDEITTARLCRLHAPWYRRRTADWSARAVHRAERGVLALAFFGLLTAGAAAILRTNALSYASPFLWPVMACGSAVVLAVCALSFQLWVKREYGRARRGLDCLVFLAVSTVGVAVGGLWIDLARLSAVVEGNLELMGPLLVRGLIQEATLLCVSILFALFGALGWLVFTQLIAVHEEAHRRALALDSTLFEEI